METKEKKYMMLACRNIEDEIEAAMREYEVEYPVLYLQSGTHDKPDYMHRTLQEIIDSLTGIDYLLLPMGRCGNATLGLRSDRFSIVLPKCDDCINLLLSENSLKVDRPHASMFYTAGWMRSSRSAANEYDSTTAKYGKDQADMIMQMIYGGYKHFSLLDTGLYDMDKAERILTPLATCVSVDMPRIKAPYGVLKKMVDLELDNENFAVIPPGTEVTEEMLSLE